MVVSTNGEQDRVSNTRNSNIELLRIIAMFMIVAIHACMYIGTFCSGTIARFFNGTVNGICNIGVTLFILISGYYGIRCKMSKLVHMECMMITFSLMETLVIYVFSPGDLQGAALLEQLVKSCLPFITRKYWFYSCYVCVMLLSGFIERLINALGEKELRRLLILMLGLFSVLPTLFYFEIMPDNGKGLVQMIMLYMAGRYICKYQDVQLPRWTILVFMVLWAINGFSHEHAIQIGGIYHHLCKDNSITNICMAVILFYAFKEWRLASGAINVAARQIFAVFALNNTLTRITMESIQASGFDSPDGVAGFVLFLGTVSLILIGCIVIGAARSILLQRLDTWIIGLVERCWNRIDARNRT